MLKRLFSTGGDDGALIAAGLPGSSHRLTKVDESRDDWRARAGRAEGPDTYQHGDLCASMLREAAAMSVRERSERFGGPVLLVGVVEARDLMPSSGSGSGATASPYASIALVDDEGREISDLPKGGHVSGVAAAALHAHVTRTVRQSLEPDFDELFVVGQHGADVTRAAALRVRLSDYDATRVFSKHEKAEGVVEVPMKLLRSAADAVTGGVIDEVFDIAPVDGMNLKKMTTGGLGTLRLQFLYHEPPPDPEPQSIAVRLVGARGLLAADSNGLSDPYVKAKLLTRAGTHLMTAGDRFGLNQRQAELHTSIKPETLSPEWNEVLVFNDAALGGAGDKDAGALRGRWGDASWGWAPAEPAGLDKMPVHALAARGVEKTASLLMVVKDSDFGKSDDDLGEVHLKLASVWGDEDVVVFGNSLRLDAWAPVRLHKGMPAELARKLGQLRFDLVLRFAVDLLPRPWVEAFDTDAGESYWYNAETKRAYWTMPPEVSGLPEGEDAEGAAGEGAGAGAGAGAEAEAAAAAANPRTAAHACVPSPRAHKPPRPCVMPDGTPFPAPAPEPEPEPIRAAAAVAADEGEEVEEEGEGEEGEEAAGSSRQGGHGSSGGSTGGGGGSSSSSSSSSSHGSGNTNAAKGAAARQPPRAPGAAAPSPVSPPPVPSAGSGRALAAAASVSAAPAVKKAGGSGGNGAGGDGDGDGDSDDGEFDVEAVERAVAAIPLGKAKEDAEIAMANPLARGGSGGGAAGRSSFAQMRKDADAKKAADEAARRAKEASLDPEERAQLERDRAAEARRDQRLQRMTGQLAAGYGSSSARAKLAAGSRGGSAAGKSSRAVTKAKE